MANLKEASQLLYMAPYVSGLFNEGNMTEAQQREICQIAGAKSLDEAYAIYMRQVGSISNFVKKYEDKSED